MKSWKVCRGKENRPSGKQYNASSKCPIKIKKTLKTEKALLKTKVWVSCGTATLRACRKWNLFTACARVVSLHSLLHFGVALSIFCHTTVLRLVWAAADCKMLIWGVFILLDKLFVTLPKQSLVHWAISPHKICQFSPWVEMEVSWRGFLWKCWVGTVVNVRFAGEVREINKLQSLPTHAKEQRPGIGWQVCVWKRDIYKINPKQQLQNQTTNLSLFHPFMFQTKEQSYWCLPSDSRWAEWKETPWF